jgi:tRNA1(Val) A37 N6-methylase TrmN6
VNTPEVSEDALLGGRVRLRQPAIGYRAGMDAALLAAACGASDGERVIDAGCGPGAALLQAAARSPGARFTGVERDPEAFALARGNLALNGLESRAEVRQADVRDGFRPLQLAPFDVAICNPPFFDDPDAMRAPHPARTGAYMAEGGLAVWIGFLLKAVREGGRIVVVHRAERLADLLGLLAPKAGSFAIRPVHPHADAPAKRVLVQAVKTGRAPLRLLPPLVLHARGGGHTPEAEALLRGLATLEWG